MNKTIESLKLMGCDVEGAMERFLDDEEFYMECFEKVLEDPSFQKLEEALKSKDISEAFEHAHTLKGILSNLGLTSLYEIVIGIVEPLRAGSMEGVMDKYLLLMEEREKYILLK